MTPGPDQLAAARLALAELGVTVADLEPNRHPDRPPTFGEYLPVVIAAACTGANRTYGTYWRRMAALWGDRRLDEVHASDIEAMKNTATTTARSRRTSRHGRYAGEHVIAAARAIYNRALANCLADHTAARGAVLPTDALLRFRNGHPLSGRRYDQLWKRLGDRLPWVAVQGISTHWLRHTTLTWVERHFGYAVARAYAGHTDSTGPATTTYIKANLQEVATALAAMTGQPHPLALPPWTLRSTRHPSERQPSRTRSSSWHT